MYLHFGLFLRFLFIESLNLLVLILTGQLVASEIGFFLRDGLLNDQDFFLGLIFQFLLFFCSLLGTSSLPLSIFKLSVHVVVFRAELFDLLGLVASIFLLFFLELFHVFLELHD